MKMNWFLPLTSNVAAVQMDYIARFLQVEGIVSGRREIENIRYAGCLLRDAGARIAPPRD